MKTIKKSNAYKIEIKWKTNNSPFRILILDLNGKKKRDVIVSIQEQSVDNDIITNNLPAIFTTS